MGRFDIANPIEREAQRCRTRAYCAHLFAADPADQSNAGVWANVVSGWDMLALLKARLAEERACRTKAAALPSPFPQGERGWPAHPFVPP